MITQFKIFERHWTEDEIKPTKLIERLVKFFNYFGYKERYFSGEYNVTYFEKNDTRCFYLKGGLGSTRLVINSLGNQHNIFIKYVSDYLKTINELSIYNYGNPFYFEITFDAGEIDNIISQISEKDLDSIITSKKYNI